MTDFLPFALPDIDDEEITEVVQSMRSGWLSTGPRARAFEEAFVTALGGGVEAVAVNSATAGLHLAVEALGIGPGDQVIVPTHTFTATAEVVRYVGADVVFVDIDPETYCIDPDQLEARVTTRTRAVIPVHYAGLGCDMARILAVARRLGLAVVEDAAHAFPTRIGGRLVGTLDSDCAVFSFYATKTITTGEGGMLVTRNRKTADRARIMRLHGIDRDAFDRYHSTRPAWYYEVVAPGFKYNLSDLAAAVGLQQLKKAHHFHLRRKVLAERYDRELGDLPVRLPPRFQGDQHAWHLYVIQLLDSARPNRDDLIRQMHERGIACSVHYIPLHRQPYWRDRYALKASDFPHSQRLFERGLSLPLYTRMSDDDQSRVIQALRSVLM
jgi:dTDP-4-amino-4,6-dideoxygalactose transaminase